MLCSPSQRTNTHTHTYIWVKGLLESKPNKSVDISLMSSFQSEREFAERSKNPERSCLMNRPFQSTDLRILLCNLLFGFNPPKPKKHQKNWKNWKNYYENMQNKHLIKRKRKNNTPRTHLRSWSRLLRQPQPGSRPVAERRSLWFAVHQAFCLQKKQKKTKKYQKNTKTTKKYPKKSCIREDLMKW